MAAASLSAGWYLIKPRLEQLHAAAAHLLGWTIAGTCAAFLLIAFVQCAALLKFGKSPMPYKWIEKLLLSLLPKAVWLGAKFGISRDRVGNSFIKVQNLVTKSTAHKPDPGRVLILLPRCLRSETRGQIASRINGDSFKVVTAGGGEEARESIKQFQPTLILALACERDLMSGIRDVAGKVPVLAIPNKRPDGPCKNTYISLAELDEALRFIKDGGK